MAAPFHFEHSVAFSPETATDTLRSIPALPGVFALRGPRETEEPYLTRAADLRRRITRILAPPDSQSKRLNLRDRVARIDYTITGSEFESTLTLYHASAALFGLDEARRRLRLRTPFFLRFTAENAYPRVYSTNRLSKRALNNFYGPFPSRAAADRYCDAVLDLFKLRRCYEDLAPYPEHPGCVYQEMKKCLAPCNQACTPEGAAAYTAEAAAVKRFFDTRGESMIIDIGLQREEASAAMEFEKAAALHTQWHKVKAAQSLADELVQPIPKLRAVLVQKSAAPTIAELDHNSEKTVIPQGAVILSGANGVPGQLAGWGRKDPCILPESEHTPKKAVILSEEKDPCISPDAEHNPKKAVILNEEKDPCISPAAPQHLATVSAEPAAAVFLLQSGCITGPERLSTLGVRAVKEQTSVGSSLYAQPLMLEAVPLEDPTPTPVILSEDATAVASQSKDPEAAGITDTAGTVPPTSPSPALSPELRAATLIATLEQQASTPTDLTTLSDHLSLLRRWYYRPEKQRTGEIFFPREDSAAAKRETNWPIRRILRGAARMALGEPKPMAETHRDLVQRNPEDEAQKPTRTKVLHEGRPDVERVVPILDKPPTFKSRRKPQ